MAESERARIRFTIGQFLVFVLIFGVLLGVVMDRRLLADLSPYMAFACLVVLCFMGGLAIVEGMMGASCPSCRAGRMRRVALSAFGYRFYKCDRCRARWKKGVMAGWVPVEGDEEEAKYVRRSAEDPWSLPPESAREEQVVWSDTHTSLLRNKQIRNPNAPRQRRQERVD